MKMLRISLLVLGLAIAAATTAKAASLGKQLVDLESHIKWSAVDDAWKNLRDDWVRTTSRCDEAACVAAQLLKLEQNVKWNAVDKAWRDRRAGWINDCKGATTERAVAGLCWSSSRTSDGAPSMKNGKRAATAGSPSLKESSKRTVETIL